MSAESSNELWRYLLWVAVLLVSILFFKKKRNNKQTLPGPYGLPIVGNAFQMGNRPHVTFMKWAEKYGSIFKIKVAQNVIIVISDPKLAKELFSDYASSGRWTDNPVMTEFTKGPFGVINSEGENWESQRRFTLRTLREFGYARSTMEDLILEEVHSMVKWFKKRQGELIVGNRIFNAAVVNSLWRLVTGERYDWDSSESKPPIHEAMDEFMAAVQVVSTNPILFAPGLRHIAPDYFGWTKYFNSIDGMINIIQKSLNKHELELDPGNPKDFIDHHLTQIKSTTDPKSSFYKELGYKNLYAGTFDLFFAGSETTSHTLSWVLLYLSHSPEVQRKLSSEIDRVIGAARVPSLADKINMPYTEAVILETLRMSTVLSVGVMHRMLNPLEFHGYSLERGTVIFANLYGIHHDPKIWGDPNTFRPERFLSDDETTVIRHEALIPFLEGKRKCLGEGFARDSLFLFTVAIFQNFKVLPPDGTTPDFEPDLGTFQTPKPFKVLVCQKSD